MIRFRIREKVWFNDECRRAYSDKQQAYKLWSRDKKSRTLQTNYTRLRSRAMHIYAEAELEYNNSLKTSLTNASCSHKWWSTLKKSQFGSESSLPPLRDENR